MVRGYTTIEQSKKLLELGLDPSTSDMCFVLIPRIDFKGYIYNSTPVTIPYKQYTAKDNNLPCWSLAALLEIIIPIQDKVTKEMIRPLMMVDGRHLRGGISYVDAAFRALCYEIENGYIETNK